MTAPATSREDTWLRSRERGTSFWIRALVWWADTFGRGGATMPLYITAFWYALLDGPVRRASGDYLRRVFGRVTFRMVQRHVRTFARVTLDRVYFLRDRREEFRVQYDGIEYLEQLMARGQGAMFLGAHLGSFEAARMMADFHRFPINVLVHTANARQINGFLRQINPNATLRVIEIDPDDQSYIFRVQEAIERGEFVAILADRVGLNQKKVLVQFLGEAAWFPTGPYALAAALGCPVFLTFGLFHEPNRYVLHAEPFAERLRLPRRERAAALREHAQRFAARLESYVRRGPYNWFNFYPFWDATGGDAIEP